MKREHFNECNYPIDKISRKKTFPKKIKQNEKNIFPETSRAYRTTNMRLFPYCLKSMLQVNVNMHILWLRTVEGRVIEGVLLISDIFVFSIKLNVKIHIDKVGFHIIDHDRQMMSVVISDYMETLNSDRNTWKQLTAIVSDLRIGNFSDPTIAVRNYMETRL